MHSVASLKLANTGEQYLLDLNVMQPGDIVLSTTSQAQSRFIRFFTNSPYSHAMLYVGHSLIHADGGGVFSLNPQRKLVHSGQISVFRLTAGLDGAVAQAIANYGRGQIGSLYTVPHALLVGLLKLVRWPALDGKQFCSRLVAQAYRSVGIKLVRNPDYCSPGALARSGKLGEVRNALRVATAADLALARTDDQVLENQLRTFNWLRRVRELAARKRIRIDNINSAFEFVERNPEFDSEVARFVRESGYLNHYLADESANRYRYDVQAFLAMPSLSLKMVLDELDINVREAERASNTYSQLVNKPSLSVFDQERELHRSRILQIIDRMQVLMVVAGSSGSMNVASNAHMALTKLRFFLEQTTKIHQSRS